MTQASHSSRRTFLKQAAAAGVAVPMVTSGLMAAPPSNRVRLASFGAGGMAGADLSAFLGSPNVELVAVADVDRGHLGGYKPDGKVKVYQDWRQMLDQQQKNLDAVSIGTPDHMHAPMAMSAMQLGLHAYIQKPLAHDIYEVRRLTEVAREKKLVTQMGIQIHSSPYYRLGVEVVRSGGIGKVKEIHIWSNKQWGDKGELPQKSDPVPANFNWDLWLGVCAERPFIGGGYYHPGNWRRRLDFGTGTFGDMGCHIFDPPFEAAGLTSPLSVRSEGPAPNKWNWANNAVIHYVFPATPYTEGPTIPVHWYDGEAAPPREIGKQLIQQDLPGQGSLLVGTKGIMLLPHIDRPSLFPKEAYKDYKFPKVQGTSHHHQFIDAILGKTQTGASTEYAGPLTESVLLGGLATRFPKTTLEWDAKGLKFTNSPEATQLIRRTYRKGWEVAGLS